MATPASPIEPRTIPGELPATMRPHAALPAEEAHDRFWNVAALLAVALVAIAGAGAWAYGSVRESLQDIRRVGLSALLEAQVGAVLTWIDEKKLDAERWASTPAVQAAAAELASSPASGCEGPLAEALAREIQPYAMLQDAVAFEVVRPSGAIVAAHPADACGRRVESRDFRDRLAPAFDGRAVFIRPFAEAERLGAARPWIGDQALVWVHTPVRDARGEVVASLGFARPAATRFAKLLALRDMRTTREAYAFDRRAVMLTPSRYLGDLRASGLVDPGSDGVLAIRVTDPGGDVSEGFRPEPAAWRPLTRLAEEALTAHGDPSGGEEGAVLEPYRNYRGALVVGAFRWLPGKDMAVAVEIEAAEAFAPLESLRIAFGGLFAFLLASLLAAGGSSLWAIRLRAREARRLGPYVLLRELGEGGMSRVHLARHELLKRPTAVKVLKRGIASDEMVARFEREVRLCSRLKHPNTVDIYDYGRTREGTFYYAMEYLRGMTFEQLVRAFGPMPWPRAVHALRQACASLADAHAQGLVHRDVKPGNLMLCVQGARHDVVKVLDFGLVKEVKSDPTRDITLHTRVLGTPLYMSPERIRSPAAADPRADVYSLGAVAFFLLAGRPAFESPTDHGLVHAILHDPPPTLAQCGVPDVPAALEALVAACLAKDPEDRPAGMEAMGRVLDELAARGSWDAEEARAWWRDRPLSEDA